MTPHLATLTTTITPLSPEDAGEALFIAGIFLNDGKPVLTPSAAAFDGAHRGMITQAVEMGAFDARPGSTHYLMKCDAFPGGIALVGLGEMKAYTPKVFKQCIAQSVRAFNWAPAQAYAAVEWLPPDMTPKAAARLFASTALNALTERFTLKTKGTAKAKTAQIYWVDEDASHKVEEGLKEGAITAEGMSIMRGLADLPGNICTPSYLAEAVSNTAQGLANIDVTVLDEHAIADLGMGAFLAVAQGSVVPPRFIAIRYRGADEKAPEYALVGKGITFDAGGISLKSAANMADMTYDMSGAAAVIGTVMAMAKAQCPINLLGVVAACENLPSGSAAKPGDVVTSLSGKTIEIINTDAEGRMILADALTWTARQKPALMIDAATLTSACGIALGFPFTGLFTPDEALAEDLLKAGRDTLDEAWRLPVGADYLKQMETPAADLANSAKVRQGGASNAASFLSVFTEDVPWAHLDIAATANTSGRDRLSTGRPVPMLTRFLFKKMR